MPARTRRLFPAVAVVALGLPARPAHGQTTYTWAGTASTSWQSAATWVPAGVPTAADAVVFQNDTLATLPRTARDRQQMPNRHD